jgi:hypothetical protein
MLLQIAHWQICSPEKKIIQKKRVNLMPPSKKGQVVNQALKKPDNREH